LFGKSTDEFDRKSAKETLTVFSDYYIPKVTMRSATHTHQNFGTSRRFKLLVGSCATALLLSLQAKALVFNYSNLTGTEVAFAGGAFSFTSVGGYQFQITTVDGGVGDAQGLDGFISGGPFNIGAITTAGIEQSAPVTGTGMLHITDASSVDLTGSIQWLDIATFGVGGVLDLTGTVNLTGINYTGSNQDLLALKNAGSATEVVTFQFIPGKTLTQLVASGGTTSYSGGISPVPEPTTLTLVGMGFAGLLAVRRNRKN